jgi:hypothetical protein
MLIRQALFGHFILKFQPQNMKDFDINAEWTFEMQISNVRNW